MQKSVSDHIFEALGSSPEPLKQVAALEEVNKKIVAGFFSFNKRENDDAAHLQSGGDNESV